jgi:hypothetical protein
MEEPSMRVVYAAFLLLLLTASCTHIKPDTPASEPPSVAAQPAKPKPAAPPVTKPAAKPAAPAKPRPAPANKPAPAPSVTTPAPKAAIKAAPPVSKPAVTPALDLNSLETQLKGTKAIGILTKLTLKNQVDDLLDQFRAHYDGKEPPMKDLRRSYDLLIMKVLSLVQDEDQRLASSIVSSREAIWGLLADPKKFATFQS